VIKACAFQGLTQRMDYSPLPHPPLSRCSKRRLWFYTEGRPIQIYIVILLSPSDSLRNISCASFNVIFGAGVALLYAILMIMIPFMIYRLMRRTTAILEELTKIRQTLESSAPRPLSSRTEIT
jgi:hypothetical protein